jgi:predicted Zn-dependent protease
VALAHATRLLDRDPRGALEQAAEILKVVPDQPNALALRGLALGRLGSGEEAIEALRRAVHLKPALPEAWRALGDHYTALEMREAADGAYAQSIRHSTHDPRLMSAAMALVENRIPDAEGMLREHLKRHPTDVAAIRMLAEVAARIGRYADAENLLSRCLELAPGFGSARHNYAVVLHRQNKSEAALAQVEQLLVDDPRNPSYRNLKAAILGRVGEYAASIEQYRSILADYPNQARVWMSMGHALKTAGNNAESIDAYLKTIGRAPNLGEAYWSLANL